ncbi:MAG: ferrochelatase [Chitinophagaceae bacterium]|jgi:ferrochelatase|nr:ferrochelatase [Chitinophagaceae bacterium]
MANRGFILMNLGSPDSTEVKDVKKYLTQFLMDERVIDKSYIYRLLLVKGIIVPFRASKSAHAYKTIWWKEGSPLVEITKQLQKAVQEQISETVEIAMRYGNPAPQQAYKNLLKSNPDLKEVIVLPLYPHYATSSYETAVEYMKSEHKKYKHAFELKFVPPFFNHPDYIDALAQSIEPYLNKEYHVLFSYHGIPARHLHGGDKQAIASCIATAEYTAAHKNCYRYEVFETTKLVIKKLSIDKEKTGISFQSRLGKGWLEPFTDKRLQEMPKEGIKKLLVICPAFVSDCLETLEEIAIRGKDIFMAAGGEYFEMIPCMNVQPAWVNAVVKLFKEKFK